MKTKAPATPAVRQHASQTLTLDMDLPPVAVKPTRKASVPKATIASPIVMAAVPLQAKPESKKPAIKKPLPAAAKPAVQVKATVVKAPPLVQAKPITAKQSTAAPKAAVLSGAAKKKTVDPAPVRAEVKTSAAPTAMAVKGAAKPKQPVPAPEAVRAERELALEGGRLWRMSGRHAVAYVQNASLACALLAVETKHLARHAMAVYYDKKGRAIGWQVRFDAQQWDEVIRRLG